MQGIHKHIQKKSTYPGYFMLVKSSSAKKIIQILLHVAAWAVFLSLPAIFNPRRVDNGIMSFVHDVMEPPRMFNALLLIAVFYFNYYIAIPLLYIKRHFLWMLLSLAGCFGLFFLINYLMMPPEFAHPPFPGRPPGVGVLGNSFNLFMFIIVYAASFAMCLYDQWQLTKEDMLNAEIAFLKAQINPHFLFNTLNSIYSLTLVKSDKAPDAVVKLSGMMRYTVTEAMQDYVSLSKEAAYIANYIDLQKLRLPDNVKVSFTLSGQPDNLQIAPFLLIPFIENAFKYGVNSEDNSDIRIELAINDTNIRLQVRNRKVFVRSDKEPGIRLGTETTKKRLDLLYPGKHTLDITDNADEFNVILEIHLT